MGKFLVRITTIIVSIYLLLCCYFAQFHGIDLLDDWYSVVFEFIVVVYAYSEGKYHCKYLKHLTPAIFLSDTLARLDNAFDFLTVSQHNLIPIGILSIGILVSTCSAIRHFYKVKRIKNGRKEHYANKTNGNITA